MPDFATATERLAELRRRWEEDPSSPVFLQLAEEHRRMGQTDEALKVLDAGLAKNPSYLAAQVSRGRCLLDLGRTAESVAALEPVLERDATQLVARKLLVEARLRLGEPARARRQLDLYSNLNPSDPEIDALRDRIQGLMLADPEPLRPSAPLPPSTPAPSGPSGPGPRAAALTAVPSAAPLDPRDPFPDLRPMDRRRHLGGLATEGIFVLAPAADPEPVAPPPESVPASALEETAAQEDPFPVLEAAAPEAAGADDEPEAASPGSGPDDETLPFVSPEPAAAPEEERATVTLGELYLRQGHHGEAESIFLSVLRQDPGNAQARSGLATLAQAGREAELERETEAPGETAAARKVLALGRYLTRLRAGVERDVS